ncbi:MAG: hypothetical protein U0L49_00220 [Eubacterium sp.]|nr:hypothetical protein [Eubacterium sp.]
MQHAAICISRLQVFLRKRERAIDQNMDLAQFHTIDEYGNATGTFDANIVDYLKKNFPCIILKGTPYLYEHGVYLEDKAGIKLKAKIQSLIYPALVKAGTIQRIYLLLLIQQELVQLNKVFCVRLTKNFDDFCRKSGKIVEFPKNKKMPKTLDL